MNLKQKPFPRVLLPDKPEVKTAAQETAISHAAREDSKHEDHLLLCQVYHKEKEFARLFWNILRRIVNLRAKIPTSRPEGRRDHGI